MIASLRGVLAHKDAQGVVVECGGVGYAVAMPLPCLTALPNENNEVHVLVHTHLPQDALRLYGFTDALRRRVFVALIGISGVGPSLALAILSMFSPEELSDIAVRGDKGQLVRIPGVGAKKAAKLLLELKDRLPQGVAPGGGMPCAQPSIYEDLVSALVNLGFKDGVAEDAGRRVLEVEPAEKDIALLVKKALRLTTRVN